MSEVNQTPAGLSKFQSVLRLSIRVSALWTALGGQKHLVSISSEAAYDRRS
jgi:hypothetical protein